MCHLRIFVSLFDSVVVTVPLLSFSVYTLGRSPRCLAATALNPIGKRPRVKCEVFFLLLGMISSRVSGTVRGHVQNIENNQEMSTQERERRQASEADATERRCLSAEAC